MVSGVGTGVWDIFDPVVGGQKGQDELFILTLRYIFSKYFNQV